MKTTIEKRSVPVSLDSAPQHMARRSVVMVASPGEEPTRADVSFNLATVCAEVGQRVAIVSTSVESEREAAHTDSESDENTVPRGSVEQLDLRNLLGDSAMPKVSLLDLKDLTVHHGQALAPLTDVVLVVAERRFTTFDQLRQTNTMLQRLGAPVVGMALTNEHDYWLEDEQRTQPRAAEQSAFEVRPEDADGTGTVEEGVAAAAETHRRRRPVVDHASVGARTDQTDVTTQTPEA
jgi:Mrp family chromosome partitioning ATPase